MHCANNHGVSKVTTPEARAPHNKYIPKRPGGPRNPATPYVQNPATAGEGFRHNTHSAREKQGPHAATPVQFCHRIKTPAHQTPREELCGQIGLQPAAHPPKAALPQAPKLKEAVLGSAPQGNLPPQHLRHGAAPPCLHNNSVYTRGSARKQSARPRHKCSTSCSSNTHTMRRGKSFSWDGSGKGMDISLLALCTESTRPPPRAG